jgi:hypothetical protein
LIWKRGGGPAVRAKEMYWLSSSAGFDGAHGGKVAFGDLGADGGAERRCGEPCIVAGGIEGRHHREQGGTGIELAEIRLVGARHEREGQQGWED